MNPTHDNAAESGPRLKPAVPGEDGVDPALAEQIRAERGGRLLLLYRVLLNSPPVAMGWLKLFTALRQQTQMPGRLREIVILRIAALNKAEYEYEAHVPFAKTEHSTTVWRGISAAATCLNSRCWSLPTTWSRGCWSRC